MITAMVVSFAVCAAAIIVFIPRCAPPSSPAPNTQSINHPANCPCLAPPSQAVWNGLRVEYAPSGDERFLVSDATGERVNGETYLTIDRDGFFHDRLIVSTAMGYGVIDTRTAWVVRPGYQHIERFSCGLAKVVRGGKVGYIDTSGNVVIPLTYDWGMPHRNGLAVVGIKTPLGRLTSAISDTSPNMRFHVLDLQGRVVVGPDAEALLRKTVP